MAPGFVCYSAAAGGTGHCPACRQQTNFGGGLGEREANAEPPPARGGQRPPLQSAEDSADSKNPAALIYGGWVRVLSGGSKRNRALPGRSRQRRHEFSGESRKTEEPGSLNLWLPGSCATRRQQVEPGTARPAGSRQTSVGVWGSAKRMRSLPQPGRSRQRRHEFSGESRKTEEPGSFNLWLPGSCSIPRQQVEPGPARRRQQVEPGTARRRTQPLQYMAAGFVFYPAAASGSRHCRPA